MIFSQQTQFSKGVLIFSLLLVGLQLSAQRDKYFISGRVVDASNNEPIPYATVGAPGTSFGTRTDDEGIYRLPTNVKIKELRFLCVGYKAITIPVTSDSLRITLDIALEPQTEALKEVIIKPKKYRNKNNPTVALINLVVDNREKNRVENISTFKEEQYEKIMMGITNLSEKTKNRKSLKSWKFVMDNVDTTKLKGAGIIPAYLQENVQDFYSKNDPKRNKIRVKGTQQVIFPLMDQDGIDRYVRYLYQDVNIYDNYVVLLTDHFLSPIANNAPLFYRYYPVDTTVENGSKIVRLQFFPRNKTDMLLQGELYVALDSTYPVTKITFTVNPNINLNWARYLDVTQEFQKMSNGKWVLFEETLDIDLGITKRSLGVYGQRYLSHRNPQVGIPLEDSLFQGIGDRVVLAGAVKKDTAYWSQTRHVDLTKVEAATYNNIDSLQKTRLFTKVSKTVTTLVLGYYKPKNAGLEIGRINSFYSFNDVEGDRLRFGGRTNPKFSKKYNFEGFGAYGLKDKRWKYGVAANISLAKDRSYNNFPYNMIRVNYQQDMTIPGAIQNGPFATNNLFTSFTRASNDRFFFQKKLVLQYEKEYRNNFSYMIGFEHRDLTPQGSLRFVSTEDALPTENPIITAKPFIQVRYAPGEEFYQNMNGWRQRIRFNFIGTAKYSRGVSGILGSEYNFDEVTLTAYKFSNTYPLGYNYCFLEAGGIFGKVPYPLLAVHRGNQSITYRFMAYNMMNFMEFVSDRYVALNMEQSFYGFFTNKIPLVKKLKLREIATVKVLYGQVSKQNQPTEGSGLYKFPTYADGRALTYTLEGKPYVEASIGIGNIFKVIRLELVRRFTYLDHPQTAKYGIRVSGQMQF
jgi:hypothetical protein